MKTYKLLYFIVVGLLCSCNHATEQKPMPTVDYPAGDTFTLNSVNTQQITSQAKNGLLLMNNKVYLDSLVPYFKYKDLMRLDHINNISHDSLKEIVFSNNKIKMPAKSDTLFLGEHQYLIGNVKTDSENSIIAIVSSYEDWGQQVILLTIDKFHNIIDHQAISANCSDGGDFYRAYLKHLEGSTYEYITKYGYAIVLGQPDTIKYTKETNKIIIRRNGTFETHLMKVDSNIVEAFK